jgi:SAM-dependent methyltransferase
MDTAASSGVTTIEWSKQLEAVGLSFEMIATDKLLSANLLSIAPGIKALADDSGNAIHFDCFGHGMSPRISLTPLAPLKAALRILFAVTYKRSKPSVPVAMMMPANEITAEADDLLSPTPKKWLGVFDVVRAANILHKTYFSSTELALAIENLQKRLRPGGLLIITRTREHDGKNEASILRTDGGTLSILGRLNGGSEVEFVIKLGRC